MLPTQPEAAEVASAELPAQLPVRAVGFEVPRRHLARGVLGRHRLGKAGRLAHQQFGRLDTFELRGQGFLVPGFQAHKAPSAEIQHGESKSIAVRVHRHEQRLPVPFEQRLVGERARGHDARHLPMHRSPAGRGVSNLLADGRPLSATDEPGEVGIHGVGRHSRHRDRFAGGVTARGKGDIEKLGGAARVIEEELVEISHPIEEKHVRMLGLDAQVLLHDRSVVGYAALPPDHAFRCSENGGRGGSGGRGGGSGSHRPRKCIRGRVVA